MTLIRNTVTALFISLFLFVEPSFATSLWYYGKIDRVWRYNNDDFVITVSSNELDDCEHGYAYFSANRLGREHFDGLYSMALTAFVSNQKVSMVIDKELDAPKCYVKSMDMRK
jgi:hypothetical protein